MDPLDRDGAETAVKALIDALGVEQDDHLSNTPARVVRSLTEQLSGYREDPRVHLRSTFSAPHDPGLVVVSGIALKSTCAHHLLPFSGTATVAYRPSPGNPIVGLSKLARVLHGYARRLQVQERIGSQTVDAIFEELTPSGAVVLVTAVHDCMRLRGVGEPDAATTTVAKAGLVLPEEWDTIRLAHFGR